MLRQQELNRAMVLAESTTNLMQRLSSLPTALDVSPLCCKKTILSSLSHKHHLHIRWCCIDLLRSPAISVYTTPLLACPNATLNSSDTTVHEFVPNSRTGWGLGTGMKAYHTFLLVKSSPERRER